MSAPQPDDVTTASGALAALSAVGDADPRWSRRAAPTTWTAARTVTHIADALLFYAGQVARRADHRLPVLRDGRAASELGAPEVLLLVVTRRGITIVCRDGYCATCERVAIDYPVMPVEQYVAGLNRKLMGAGVLLRDAVGRVLLVEPSYKPDWGIPGGAVEADESPWAAAARELSEELDLDRPLGQLLVVDYVRAQDSFPECVVFVFDGGILDKTAVERMVFPDGEIISAAFHTLAEVRSKVKPLLADRLDAAVQAVEQSVTTLCEQGRRIA